MNEQEIKKIFTNEEKREQKLASRSSNIIIVNTVLCAVLFFVSLGLIMAAAMANDSGKKNMLIWELAVLLSIALPFVCIISIIVFWICYKKKAYTAWLVFSLLPWVNLLLVIILTIILFS